MEAILDAGAPYVSGRSGCRARAARPLGAGGRRHARQDDDDVDAGLDPGAAGLAPGFLIGGVPMNFGVSARLGSGRLRDRGRRVRHGVLRQALEVRALPAAHRDPEQPRVRPRGHLPGPRGHRDPVPPSRAHRARQRPAGRERRDEASRACWRAAAGARSSASAPKREEAGALRARGEPQTPSTCARMAACASAGWSGRCSAPQPAERAGRDRRGRARGRRARAWRSRRWPLRGVRRRLELRGDVRRRDRLRRLRAPPDGDRDHVDGLRQRVGPARGSWRCSSRAPTR
jgi:UDP-N-acetylmuramate: L-alanyl-gamma-D-glutamyl-meso-diaminopimelate ligase